MKQTSCSFARFLEKGRLSIEEAGLLEHRSANSLAEAEVEYAEREDPAILVKFPIVSGPLAQERRYGHLDDDAVDAASKRHRHQRRLYLLASPLAK